MKRSGSLLISGFCAVLFAAGCGGGGGHGGGGGNGGGGGGGGNATDISGIWSGTSTQTRAVGDVSQHETEFFQNGHTLTGSAVVTKNGVPKFPSITGTIAGTQVTTASDYGVDGISTFTGTVNGTALTGTYTHIRNGVMTGGTVSLTRSVGLTTANIGGTWTGTGTVTGGSTKPVTITFTQSQDSLTITGAAGHTFTGNGAIIGDKLAFVGVGNNGTLTASGAVTGNTITGTAQDTSGNAGAQTITFTVTKSN